MTNISFLKLTWRNFNSLFIRVKHIKIKKYFYVALNNLIKKQIPFFYYVVIKLLNEKVLQNKHFKFFHILN